MTSLGKSGPEIVFALYTPHEGKLDALLKIVRTHVPTLRRLEFVTDRPAIVAKSSDGTVIEVFEWASGEAARAAHDHPEVAALWESIGTVSKIATLADLPEAKRPFCHLTPV